MKAKKIIGLILKTTVFCRIQFLGRRVCQVSFEETKKPVISINFKESKNALFSHDRHKKEMYRQTPGMEANPLSA